MTHNPYQPPETTAATDRPAHQTTRWLSNWGMVGLAMILGILSSVVTFGGRTFSAPALSDVFGFGGLGLCVLTVTIVSVRLGLRHPEFSGWRHCTGTSLAGSVSCLFGVIYQMSKSPTFRDFGMLLGVVVASLACSLIALSLIRWLQKRRNKSLYVAD